MRDYCYLEVGGEVVFCLRIISKIAVLSEGALAPPGACAPHRWPGSTPLLGTLQAAEGSSPLCQEGGTNGLQSLHLPLSAHPSATSVRCLALNPFYPKKTLFCPFISSVDI